MFSTRILVALGALGGAGLILLFYGLPGADHLWKAVPVFIVAAVGGGIAGALWLPAKSWGQRGPFGQMLVPIMCLAVVGALVGMAINAIGPHALPWPAWAGLGGGLGAVFTAWGAMFTRRPVVRRDRLVRGIAVFVLLSPVVYFVTHLGLLNSDAFAVARDQVSADSATRAAVGNVLGVRLAPLGASFLQYSGSEGSAQFQAIVRGDRGAATVRVRLTMVDAVWAATSIELQRR